MRIAHWCKSHGGVGPSRPDAEGYECLTCHYIFIDKIPPKVCPKCGAESRELRFVEVTLPLLCAPSRNRFARQEARVLADRIDEVLTDLDAPREGAYEAYHSRVLNVRCRVYEDGEIEVVS